jgi:hypothetical protein
MMELAVPLSGDNTIRNDSGRIFGGVGREKKDLED